MEELHTLGVDLAKRTLAVYGTDKIHYVKYSGGQVSRNKKSGSNTRLYIDFDPF